MLDDLHGFMADHVVSLAPEANEAPRVIPLLRGSSVATIAILTIRRYRYGYQVSTIAINRRV